MENKINIAELLKDSPKYMQLYSPLCGECRVLNVYDGLGFDVICGDDTVYNFSYDGRYNIMGECCIFPSKENRDWSKFQRPFKDGDVAISDKGDIHLLRTKDSSYCAYRERWNGLPKFDKTITTDIKVVRHATEEEKQTLFQAIKDNGYKWNSETKTLETLIEPKFKVGDKIRNKHINSGTDVIIDIEGNWYILLSSCEETYLNFKCQDNYELVPNKFDITNLKPFESKVLVRNSDVDSWCPAIFGCKRSTHTLYKYATMAENYYAQCIPYEGNEHLVGTKNDCDEYYKNW